MSDVSSKTDTPIADIAARVQNPTAPAVKNLPSGTVVGRDGKSVTLNEGARK